MPKKKKKRKEKKNKTTQRTETLSTELSETENSPTLLITAKKTKNQNKISRLLANTKAETKTNDVWGNNLFESSFQQGGYIMIELVSKKPQIARCPCVVLGKCGCTKHSFANEKRMN